MTTTPNGDSIRVPTPADLQKLPDSPYTPSQAKLGSPIFEAVASRGELSTAQAVKLHGVSKRKSVEQFLDAACARRHLSPAWNDRGERVYRFGPEYALIDVRTPHKTPHRLSDGSHSLQDRYRQTIRPLLVGKRLEPKYLRTFDRDVQLITDWKGQVDPANITDEWLTDLGLVAKERLSETSCRLLLARVRRLVLECHLYHVLAPGTEWSVLSPILRTEPRGCFGRYYAAAFEKSRYLPRGTKHNYRLAVRLFLRYVGTPITLRNITQDLLSRFISHEIHGGRPRRDAVSYASSVRRIVEHGSPGRLPHFRSPIPERRDPGTVQDFFETVFVTHLMTTGRTDAYIRMARGVMRDFDEFCDCKGLPCRQFDKHICKRFLDWCLEHRSPVGKSLGPRSLDIVNHKVRCILQRFSILLASRGILDERLYLEPIGSHRPEKPHRSRLPAAPRKRQPNPTANGHAIHASTNGRPAESNATPSWDSKAGVLRLADNIREVASQATAVRKIFDQFQAAGWPNSPLLSPFDEPVQHHNAIRAANKGQCFLRFTSAHNGKFISCRKTANLQTN